MLFGDGFENKIKEALKVLHRSQSTTRGRFFFKTAAPRTPKEEAGMDKGEDDTRTGTPRMLHSRPQITKRGRTANCWPLWAPMYLHGCPESPTISNLSVSNKCFKMYKVNFWAQGNVPAACQKFILAGILKHFLHNWEKLTQDQ